MSFLSPLALFGLLTLLVPLILHFIKKSEVKELDWAAMEFLVKKDTQSMRRKSLKNIPLLLSRLALLTFLVLALARPVGNLFNLGKQSPDSVFILLDRSPEMGGRNTTEKTHLERGLAEVSTALQGFPESTRVNLIDSASLEITPVLSPDYLPLLAQSQQAAPPSSALKMVSKSLSELERGEFGKTEFWIVTNDLAESWDAKNSGWNELKNLVQTKAEIRPFVYKTNQSDNLSLSLTNVIMQGEEIVLELQILDGKPEQVVTLQGAWSDGKTIQEEVIIQESQENYQIPLLTKSNKEINKGSGILSLPKDGNPHNNDVYFSFGPPLDIHTLIITDEQDSTLTNYLSRAAALSSRPHQKTRWVSPEDALLTDLSSFDFLVWAAGNESPEARVLIEDFVSAGGTAVVFPSPTGENHQNDWFFTEVIEAPLEEFFSIESWRQKSGPWMNSKNGDPLPIQHLQGILIARPTTNAASENTSLAAWTNDIPALSQSFLGEGRLFLLNTLPLPTWSNMENLALHLILFQRLLQEVETDKSGGYLETLAAGRAPFEAKLRTEGERVTAINRAPRTSSARLSDREIRDLLSEGDLKVATSGKRPMRPWLYPFLLIALIFFIVEALLQIFPPRFRSTQKNTTNA